LATQYATTQDFIQAFGEQEAIQLSNLDNPMGDVVDANHIDQALQDASEEVNSYVRSRYATPISDPPRALKRWVMDIARYLLHRYDPTDTVKKNHEDALRFLREVRDGKKAIDLTATTQEPINSVGAPETFALDDQEPPSFGDLRGYRGWH
jgi:phage gp36-like protein